MGKRLRALLVLVTLGAPCLAWGQNTQEILTSLSDAPTPERLIDGKSWQLGAGLVTALPTALGPGLSTGVGVEAIHGGTLSWGARASWSQATEYTELWAVTHQEIRVRAVGVLQAPVGRATVGLHLGLGPTVLYESRVRAQSARLGNSGLALNQRAWAVAPGVDLQVAVALPIFVPFDAVGPVGAALSLGPTLHVFQGETVLGWVAHLSVAVWR